MTANLVAHVQPGNAGHNATLLTSEARNLPSGHTLISDGRVPSTVSSESRGRDGSGYDLESQAEGYQSEGPRGGGGDFGA